MGLSESRLPTFTEEEKQMVKGKLIFWSSFINDLFLHKEKWKDKFEYQWNYNQSTLSIPSNLQNDSRSPHSKYYLTKSTHTHMLYAQSICSQIGVLHFYYFLFIQDHMTFLALIRTQLFEVSMWNGT